MSEFLREQHAPMQWLLSLDRNLLLRVNARQCRHTLRYQIRIWVYAMHRLAASAVVTI